MESGERKGVGKLKSLRCSRVGAVLVSELVLTGVIFLIISTKSATNLHPLCFVLLDLSFNSQFGLILFLTDHCKKNPLPKRTEDFSAVPQMEVPKNE
jgi:hypothetical protein